MRIWGWGYLARPARARVGLLWPARSSLSLSSSHSTNAKTRTRKLDLPSDPSFDGLLFSPLTAQKKEEYPAEWEMVVHKSPSSRLKKSKKKMRKEQPDMSTIEERFRKPDLSAEGQIKSKTRIQKEQPDMSTIEEQFRKPDLSAESELKSGRSASQIKSKNMVAEEKPVSQTKSTKTVAEGKPVSQTKSTKTVAEGKPVSQTKSKKTVPESKKTMPESKKTMPESKKTVPEKKTASQTKSKKRVPEEKIPDEILPPRDIAPRAWSSIPEPASQTLHNNQLHEPPTPSARPEPVEVTEPRFASLPPAREAEYGKVLPAPLKKKIRATLPDLPPSIHTDPHDTLRRLSAFHCSWSSRRKNESVSFSCALTASSYAEPFKTIGHGATKAQAKRAAFQCMFVEFYERRLLHHMWGPPDHLLHKVLDEEKDAIVHVYDYAARYGYIPTLRLTRVTRSRARVYIVEIALPEHDILVTSKHSDLVHAEIAVALKFKRAAEDFQLRRQSMGDKYAEETSPLSSATSTSFLAYLRDQHARGVKVDIETNETRMGIEATVSIGNQPSDHKVLARSKRIATVLANVVGAVIISKQNPETLKAFADVLEANQGRYVQRAAPVNLYLTENAIKQMKEMNPIIQGHLRRLERDTKEAATLKRWTTYPTLNTHQQVEKSQVLKRQLDEYENRPDLNHIRHLKSQLPMSQNAPKLLELVENNIYSIVIGATGSGKTTQVPQILLDDAIRRGEGASCNIICTQPRRIAATSVARRVADERAEKLEQTVGYHVRFDSRLPRPHGSILYATTGILLQQLQHSPEHILNYASHFVIDEVHDRDINLDLLLLTVKRALSERAQKGLKIPRVILMSATMDSEFFANYFRGTVPSNYQGAVANDCPALSVPGRTFPVEEHYLGHIMSQLEKEHGSQALYQLLGRDKDSRQYVEAELAEAELAEAAQPRPIDWNAISDTDTQQDSLVPLALTAATVAHIAKTTDDNGGVLVFLPGLDEILKLKETLLQYKPFGVDFLDESKFRIFMLHSTIRDSQQNVFDALPPGCRKIILSTNIAETSVTLPDVRYVVDTGKLRQKSFDPSRRVTSLQCTWISKSNAKQRAGRAGRVANGSYYALYTSSRRDDMRQTNSSELSRSDLQETCLSIKSHESSMKLPIGDLLSQVIEPPSPTAVAFAVQNLKSLGAIDKDETILPLGRVLSLLPVHPSLGKMIVLGIVFRCLSPMIVLGAALGERSPFMAPPERKSEAREKKRTFVRGSGSDHLAILEAFKQYTEILATNGRQAASQWCFEHFIRADTMRNIYSTTKQIEEILIRTQIVQKSQTAFNSIQSRPATFDPILDENAGSDNVIRALLAAGLSPNIAQSATGVTTRLRFRTATELRTMLSQDSANLTLPSTHRFDSHLLVFSDLALSNDGNTMFLRDTTLITPLMALLFGARRRSQSGGGLVVVDGWLNLYVKSPNWRIPFQTATEILFRFQHGLELIMASAFHALMHRQPLSEDRLLAHVATSLPRLLGQTSPDKDEATKKIGITRPHSETSQGGSGFQWPHSDSGRLRSDSGWPRSDSGRLRSDSGWPRRDSGRPRRDSGQLRSDRHRRHSGLEEPRSDLQWQRIMAYERGALSSTG